MMNKPETYHFLPAPQKAKCRSCQADILWVRNASKGTFMCLDAEPVCGGNVAIVDGLAKVVKKGDLFEAEGEFPVLRYRSHFVTCPEAKQWRKKK